MSLPGEHNDFSYTVRERPLATQKQPFVRVTNGQMSIKSVEGTRGDPHIV